jgi:GNAT superfamily N-acetyltransferase
MTITIRYAEPADVEAVLQLMMGLAEHEGLSQYLVLTAESLAHYCFADPVRLDLLVAVSDEEIVGYATLLPQLSPWAGREYLFLDDLYIVPARRGAGIGSLLMDRIATIALDRDMDVRWHVETANTSAQTFYTSLGAELRDRFIAYWTLDAMRQRSVKRTDRESRPSP